jgi:hypothetical protein
MRAKERVQSRVGRCIERAHLLDRSRQCCDLLGSKAHGVDSAAYGLSAGCG